MRKTKILAVLLAVTVVATGCGSSSDQSVDGTWPSKITFGFVPSNEQEHLQDQVQPFMQVLEEALGIEVEGVVEKAKASLKPMYDPLNKKIRN